MKNPFFDQYEIIDKLGQGGQSEVSLCKEKSTNELFAVKIRSGNQEYIDREIDILASVQSKYFVKIKATISHKQFDYIILEYCNGKTLLEKANEHYFSEKDILEFFNFILGAQYELIQMGIIHRDLKLSNILIHNGQYKLADFGISRSVYNYDQAGQITAFSHPSYNRSPQFNTRKYTSKCDVWSLGIIIYYLLFKQYPWTLDETNIQKYYNDCKILTFPQERVISQSMRELIQGCLAYEEKDRFSWTDLMKRKILGYEFSDYIKLEQQLKNIEIQLALKIMENAFQEHQTTIEQFRKDTNNLDLNKHERIAYFQNRAKKYNNQLETFQIVYIFNQIDQKHQEFIDQQQNENWLKRCKLLSEMVKQLQIQNQEDRIIIKQLFVMIYFKLQDNNLNIEQLIDEYECTFMNKRQGFILPNEFQTFIRSIDQSINLANIQIVKKYIPYKNCIPIVAFAQIYEQFWRVNLQELRLMYELLNYCQQINYDQFKGYKFFIIQFDKNIIDRYVSLDLLNNRLQQNNSDDIYDLIKEIERIEKQFKIKY